MTRALVLALVLVGCETDGYRETHQCREFCEGTTNRTPYIEVLKCIRCINGKKPRAGGGAAAPD